MYRIVLGFVALGTCETEFHRHLCSSRTKREFEQRVTLGHRGADELERHPVIVEPKSQSTKNAEELPRHRAPTTV